MTIALNFVLFQLGWFACVLGAANGQPWIGPAVVSAIVGVHLARSNHAPRELILVAIAVTVGAVFETLLLQTGWVRFAAGSLLEGTAPYWMVALWAAFATTLNVSLRWLQTKPWLAALFGLLGGPLAYYAGARLGAMEFLATPGLAVVALGWASITPFLLRMAQRFDGYAPS